PLCDLLPPLYRLLHLLHRLLPPLHRLITLHHRRTCGIREPLGVSVSTRGLGSEDDRLVLPLLVGVGGLILLDPDTVVSPSSGSVGRPSGRGVPCLRQ